MRPAVAFRTQLTLGRVDGATRDRDADARSVQRAAHGRSRRLDAAAGLGTGSDGVSRQLRVLVHRATGQQGHVGAAPDDAAGVRHRQEPRREPARRDVFDAAQPRERSGRLRPVVVLARDRRVPDRLRRAFPGRSQGARPEDSAGDPGQRSNDWLTRFASTPASTLADGRLRAYAVYLLVRQGIKPTAALSNVEQELTHRYPQAWPTDLAAAYLASTYRLMQRNDDADRIVKNVPWSAQKRDIGDEIYYDARRSRRAVAVSARAAFSEPAGRRAAGGARNAERRHQRQPRELAVGGLHAARARRLREGRGRRRRRSASRKSARTARERPQTLPAGAMPQGQRLRDRGQGAVLEARPADRLLRRQRIGFRSQSCRPRRSARASRSFASFWTRRATPRRASRWARSSSSASACARRGATGSRRSRLWICCPAASSRCSNCSRRPTAARRAPIRPSAAEGRRRLAADRRAGKSDWFPNHIDVRDDRLVLYGDAARRTRARSSIA